MSVGGVDIVWMAASVGVLLLVLLILVVVMAGGSKSRKAKRASKPTRAPAAKAAKPVSVDALLQVSSGAAAPAPKVDAMFDRPVDKAPTSAMPAATAPAAAAAEFSAPAPTMSVATPAATAAPVGSQPVDDRRIVGDFKSKDGWQSPGGGPPPAGLAGGAFALGALSGVLSTASILVVPGQIFVIDYAVRLLKAPKNGRPARYVVGPLFIDANGTALSWGSVEPELVEGERHSRVEVTPPPGAARAWLHLGGLWAQEDPQPDGLVAYTRASLEVLGV